MPSPSDVFVLVSTQRSGTSWLDAMLNYHPQIHCDSEILLDLSLLQIKEAQAKQRSCAHCLSGLVYPHRGDEMMDVVERWLDATSTHSDHTEGAAPRAVRGFKLLQGQAGIDLSGGAFTGSGVGFYRHSPNATVAFERWLDRERASIILLERQGLGRLASVNVHRARLNAGHDGGNASEGGSAWCPDVACAQQKAAERYVLPLESYGKNLAAQLDWQLHEWSALIYRVRVECSLVTPLFLLSVCAYVWSLARMPLHDMPHPLLPTRMLIPCRLASRAIDANALLPSRAARELR